MSQKREYDIAFVGLKPGLHVFEYRIDDKFFAPFGEQEFTNCTANIKLSLEKNTGFMKLQFDVDGQTDVLCDRCGNTLNKQLWDEFTIIVKLVENPDKMNEEEEDPDVYYIGRTESHLHIADWLFEFVNLAVPFQKMCNEAEMGGPNCNVEVLQKLQQMEEDVLRASSKNPLMKGLEQFKNLDN